MLKPTRDEFVHLARDAALVPVWREFLFDVDTAVTAYAKLRQPPFGFLLESVVGGEKWARHTFLGTAPREAWRIEPGGRATRRWTPADGWGPPVPSDDPLGELDAMLRARRLARIPGLPRFVGGAVGYLGYDVVRLIERLPAPKPDPLGAPWALLVLTDTLLVIDNLFGRALAVATVDVTGADAPELRRRYDAAAEAVDAMVRRLAEARAPAPLDLSESVAPTATNSSYTREAFEAHVERIRDYIARGDAFQVVLSQRLGVPLEAEPFDLYRALRSLNPSPYLFFLELDDLTLVGSSPEVLVRAEEGRVVVRPIAGTRRRGKDDDEDAALVADLLADEKERAEHLMLVDLGRNDVGRVARFGTVKVPEFMAIEKYSHVLHLVSQVEGELRDGVSAVDVFRACFPAGTVSGAPKIRAMEIIDELEPIARGPYAGAVGYFAYGGEAMDTAIAIRTLVARGGEAFVQAGAGIVADSNPAAEFEETLAKARALLRVVDSAPRPAPGADR
ncbi:MAG: anthranilate synthase component I [Gemmatimonadetes bacterium]|nr:anthranilate synthase component I [Gemmatimonadota bacterium]